MKVGDPAWVFDANRRVYPPKKPGQAYSSGGSIYREHWVKREIIGETSRSWVIGYPNSPNQTYGTIKVPKKGRTLEHGHVIFSQEELDERVWVNDNAQKIADAVRHAAPATLRRIAAIIDYKETP